MKNEFWVLCKRKNSLELVIDIYDDKYMEQSREDRFSELKSLLSNEIMNIHSFSIQWEWSGLLFKFPKTWVGIERIVKIHQGLEYAYTWLIPWYRKNPAFEAGYLVLDERYDNSLLPHYKVDRKKYHQVIYGHKEEDYDYFKEAEKD